MTRTKHSLFFRIRRGIAVRQDLTDEWRGIEKQEDFAINSSI
ncbi:MAG: hypothetical protein AABX51_06040 [Nanoarchaeota archaeon]